MCRCWMGGNPSKIISTISLFSKQYRNPKRMIPGEVVHACMWNNCKCQYSKRKVLTCACVKYVIQSCQPHVNPKGAHALNSWHLTTLRGSTRTWHAVITRHTGVECQAITFKTAPNVWNAQKSYSATICTRTYQNLTGILLFCLVLTLLWQGGKHLLWEEISLLLHMSCL